MSLLSILAALLTMAAVFAYVNDRYIGLPTTIGVMLIGLLASLGALVLHALTPLALDAPVRELLAGIDFDEAVLEGMLSVLLFAGALHINLNDLADQMLQITLLATIGVVLSTLIVGGLTWVLAGAFGLGLRSCCALSSAR